MRLTPKHWHNETWICSIRGHVTPAVEVATLSPADRRVGIEVGEGMRHVRCLRCDTWLAVPSPPAGAARWATMPDLATIPLPRRGRQLQDAILLRIIALNKASHALAFGLLTIALTVINLRLAVLKNSAADLQSLMSQALDSAGRNPARQAIASGAKRVLGLDPNSLKVLWALAALYFVIESVEAAGLWAERRWAEYVTAVATAGLLPIEIHELANRVTVLRVFALVVNLAILIWLVRAKHLFGVRGGEHTLIEHTSWEAILDAPTPATGPLARAAEPGTGSRTDTAG